MTLTILVLNQEDHPVADALVELHFTDSRGVSSSVQTNEFGEAIFNGYEGGEANVFVGDTDYGLFTLKAGSATVVHI